MIELKQAIEIGKDFIGEAIGEVENLQLEEISLSSDKAIAEVVYSFNKKFVSPNSLQKALGLEGLRNLKKIVIDSKSGEVLGMYNWSYDQREAV